MAIVNLVEGPLTYTISSGHLRHMDVSTNNTDLASFDPWLQAMVADTFPNPTGPIPISVTAQDYDRMRPDALTSNLFAVSNGRLVDVPNRPRRRDARAAGSNRTALNHRSYP